MRSWRIGTAFGIGIYLHWSFLLLPAWVVYDRGRAAGAATGVLTLAWVASVLFCLVLHELGHALTARFYGIGTRDITLYAIGGVARLERMTERPLEEILIALAGPAVNVVIAVLLTPVLVAGLASGLLTLPTKPDELTFDQGLAPFAGQFLLMLAVSNLFLVVFNLLPAFPMDGGRVLRALLALVTDRLSATDLAAKIGIVVALLMAAVGLFVLNSWMIPVIVAFVIFAGQQELGFLRYREAQRRAEPIDALPADEPVMLAPRQAGFSGFTWDDTFRVWVQWRNGRPVATYRVD